MSLSRAIQTILLSTLLISGSSTIGLFYYQHIWEKQRHDPAYQIVVVIQSTQDAEMLKTSYLAELLNLSVDIPTNLYRFKTNEASRLLLKSPVIKNANVYKIFPGTIHIDYTMRRPVAVLADYTNTALDIDGITFPLKPFFTPKKLPELFLGLEQDSVLANKDKHLLLALSLLSLINSKFTDQGYILSRVDVSDVSAPSCGQRQIVIIFEKSVTKVIDGEPSTHVESHTLRLSPENYHSQLANYLVLRSFLQKKKEQEISKDMIIDLRLSDLAFITKED